MAPFICSDEGLGGHRNVRVAVVLPGNVGPSSKQQLMNDDDRFSDNINKLYRVGAVVVVDNIRDASDVLLVSEAVDLRGTIRCFGLPELQERGRVLLWEPFVNEVLETSTPVFGEDEASVALRKKHAIFERKPAAANYKKETRQKKDPDVVDGIPCMRLGSSRSFEVRPDVLSASDQRVAARSAAKGRRRRGR